MVFQNGLTASDYKKDICGAQEFSRLQRELQEFDLNVYLSETDFETTFKRAISVSIFMSTSQKTDLETTYRCAITVINLCLPLRNGI